MAKFTQDRMYEMLSEISRKPKRKYNAGGKITEADCPFGYSLVNGKCVPDPDCEDGQCRETDEIQAIYDYASTIPQQVVNFERSMVDHIQDDLGGNAKLGWKEEGIKSFVEPSCMYIAGLGYRCAPATETYFKKFNPVHFNSNQGFIHAVDRGDVPFTRVGKFSDRNFDAQEKGNVQIGDIVNFKGADNSHAMTFVGYTEDGHPKYIDSNGDPADYGIGSVWRNLRPNTVGKGADYAYVNRFNKDRFIKDTYSKQIEELEKQARENPTYYKYGGLAKFVEGGSIQPMIDENGEARCPDGYTYNPETGWCEGYGDKCPDGYVKDPITGKCKSIAYRAIPGVLDENKKAIDRSKLEKQYTEWPEDLNLTTTKFDNLYKDPYIEQAGYYKVYSDKNDHLTLIPFYPDLNYKVEVDPNKPEGFDKSTNTYYVKSKDTHQYEKYRQWQILKQEEKENLDKIQKAGLKTSIAETTLYDAEAPEYKITSISGGIDDLDKNNHFYEENKQQAEAFRKLYEDPEYIPEAVRNQSYDDYQKKRKQGNISAEKCPECALYHGSTYDISDDYVRENMNLSSVTKEYPDVIYKKDEDGYEEPQNLDWEKQYTYADPSLDKAIPIYEPPELELEGFGIPEYDFTEGKYYPKKKKYLDWRLNQRYNKTSPVKVREKFVTKKEDPLIRFITGYDRERGTPELYKSRKNWNERYIDATKKINQDLENAENVKFPSFRGVPIASWDDYRARREYKKEWKDYVKNELPEILERNRQAKEAYQIEMQKIRAQEEADALKRQTKKYGGLMKYPDGGQNDPPKKRPVIYVDDENDPRYKDYLIRQALYNYSNNPNFEQRSVASDYLKMAMQDMDNLEKWKEFGNDYYKKLTEQIEKEYLDNPPEQSDEWTKNYYESFKDPNLGYYGSKIEYSSLPHSTLRSDKDFGRYFDFSNELDKPFFQKYAPVRWDKQMRYTDTPYSNTFATTGASRGSRNYWTTPNTVFIEDDIDRNALRKIYPNLTDADINRYIEDRRKHPDYISNNFTNNGYEYADTYAYPNGELAYLADPKKKTFIDADRLKGYLQESIVHDTPRYANYLPIWAEPEEVYEIKRPIIDMEIKRPELIKQDLGLPVLPEEPEILPPDYSPVDPRFFNTKKADWRIKYMYNPFTGRGPNNTQESGGIPYPTIDNWYTNSHMYLGDKLVQNRTDYNEDYYFGTYDDDDNYIKGELEKAEEEKRRIKFSGARSRKDKKAQKEYNKSYDEYEKLMEQKELEKKFAESQLNMYKYLGNKKEGGLMKFIRTR